VVDSGTCGVSYYETGAVTANGESFDPDGLTAAHKTLAFDTRVRVTNTANGKSVVVRINDRGPFVSGRCLDLARGAFAEIASLGSGVITARYEVLD
jgi:rare lipoprotein A